MSEELASVCKSQGSSDARMHVYVGERQLSINVYVLGQHGIKVKIHVCCGTPLNCLCMFVVGQLLLLLFLVFATAFLFVIFSYLYTFFLHVFYTPSLEAGRKQATNAKVINKNPCFEENAGFV